MLLSQLACPGTQREWAYRAYAEFLTDSHMRHGSRVKREWGASSFLTTPLRIGLPLCRRLPDAALLACRYGQRIGTISIVADDKQQAKKVESQLKVMSAIV